MRVVLAIGMLLLTSGRTECRERFLDSVPEQCFWVFKLVEPTQVLEGEQLYKVVLSREWDDGRVESFSLETPLDSVPTCFETRSPLDLVDRGFQFPGYDPIDVLNVMVVMTKSGTCSITAMERPHPRVVFDRAAQALAQGKEPDLREWDFFTVRLLFEIYLGESTNRSFLVAYLQEAVDKMSKGRVRLRPAEGHAGFEEQGTLVLELVTAESTRTLRIVPQRKPFWLDPKPIKQQAAR